MKSKPLLLLSALLLIGALVAVPLPVSAARGLNGQIAQQCVYVVAGGPTVHDSLTITATESSTPLNISLATLGSIPANTRMTLNATYGETPLTVNIAISANTTAPSGASQVGVHSSSGLDNLLTFFTLRVVPSQASESPVCNTIGLPLPESTVVVTLTSLGLGLLTQTVTR